MDLMEKIWSKNELYFERNQISKFRDFMIFWAFKGIFRGICNLKKVFKKG